MKYIILFTITVIFLKSFSQDSKSKQYLFTYEKDGKTIKDTTVILDTTLQNEINRMISDPNYKPKKPSNNTIPNTRGVSKIVKLEDSFFGATMKKLEHDSLNNLVKITGYDNDNNIKPFDKDIAIIKNKYDKSGNLIEIKNFGEDGKLISSEYEDTPIIRKKYNNKNQLIEEWYLDENENLRSEFSIIKYRYDESGKKITIGWFNKNGVKK